MDALNNHGHLVNPINHGQDNQGQSWSVIKVRATPEKTAKMTLKPEKPVNNGYFHSGHFLTSELLSEISKKSDEFGIVVAFNKSCVALLTIYFEEVRDFKKRNGS